MRRVLIGALFLLLALLAGGVGLWWWGLRTPELPQPRLTGTLEQRGFDAGGLPRSIIFYVPEQLPASVPVVLVLHGSFGSGERMRSATAWAFEVLADKNGFVVVYPDGFDGHWNDCRAMGDFEARRRGVDDVGFLRAVVARLNGDPSLRGSRTDPRRIFAVGLSNGGQMAFRLALEAPDFVAGVAAIAASLPATDNDGCLSSGRPVPVMVINGTADPINPYEGGAVTLMGPFGRRGDVRSTENTVAFWKDLAGHAADPFEHRYPDLDPDDGTVATRKVWSAPGRAEVDLVTIHGGGHTVPHPVKMLPRILGPTSHDVPAAEEIWRFFGRQGDDAEQQITISP